VTTSIEARLRAHFAEQAARDDLGEPDPRAAVTRALAAPRPTEQGRGRHGRPGRPLRLAVVGGPAAARVHPGPRDRKQRRQLAGICVEEEAMGGAHERWDRLAPRGRPAGWVCREALDAARRRGHRVGGQGCPPAIVPGDGTVADPEIAAAIARLPLDQRSVVVLHFHLGWQALRRLESTLAEQA